jgi:GH25 family lysozyme M1 (1,4-beta-N-acetylmuramidase)
MSSQGDMLASVGWACSVCGYVIQYRFRMKVNGCLAAIYHFIRALRTGRAEARRYLQCVSSFQFELGSSVQSVRVS